MADGVEVGRAHVTVTADAKTAIRNVQQDFTRNTASVGVRAGKNLGTGLMAGLKATGIGLLVAGAMGGISLLKKSNDEAREAQKVGARTANVLKTTGGAANISAKQIGALSTAISNKTGIDDEAIQSGANLLLTFTKVRNEAGKGNDIFNQATQTVQDMSVAFDQSGKASAIQLGKALNDPIKGTTALARVGVQFTDQQKEQIKTLVESGHSLDAQKIILGELKTQVGGAAAASATASEKMKVGWANLQEQIGTALLPVFDRVATIISGTIIPAVSRFITFATSLGPRLRAAFSGGGGGGFFSGLIAQVRQLFAVVAPIVRQVVGALVGQFRAMRPQIQSIWTSIKTIVTGVMFIIREVVQAVTTIIRLIWARWGTQITAIVTTVFKGLVNIISGVMKVIAGIIKLVVALIKGDWKGAWNAIKQIFAGVWQVIRGITSVATAAIRQVIIAWLAKVRSLWTAGFNAIRTFTRNLMESIRSSISDVLSRLRDRFASAVSAIGRAWDNLKAKAKSPINFVVKTVLNAGLIEAFNWVADKVGAKGISKIPWPPKGWYSGGPTVKAASDRSVAGLVHSNEHVVTADEVRKGGGHRTWERLRAMARSGVLRALPGFFLGGAAPVSGGSRRHSGYPWARWAGDFSAGTGTPVHSWNPGTVAAVKNWNYSYGHHVRVNHPGNVQTLYAHLRNAIVRVGQSVRQNQVLGYSDNTGNSTGPHLHFELKGGHGVLGGATGSGAVQAAVDWVAKLKDKIKGPLGRLKEIGNSPLAEIIKKFPHKIADAMLEKAKSFTSDIPGIGTLGNISAKGGNRALGRRMMVAAGWGLAQWPFLERLWTRESGWRTTARNPSSGAYGIPQSLPGSKMASAGGDWRTNPATQIRWGLGYIKDRYGSPLKAWGHSQRTGWYANGTLSAAPGWAVVGERGRELVNFGGGERVYSNQDSKQMLGSGVNIYGGNFGYDPQSIAREIIKEQRHKEALNPVFG